MKRNYALLLVLFLFSSYAVAQSENEDNPSDQSKTQTIAPTNNTGDTGDSAVVFEKNPLPKNQKESPAIFYIINDKPVDQMTYQRSVKQGSSK